MTHTDGCRMPPKVQAVRGRISKAKPEELKWYQKLWKILNQKGDPTL